MNVYPIAAFVLCIVYFIIKKTYKYATLRIIQMGQGGRTQYIKKKKKKNKNKNKNQNRYDSSDEEYD